MNQEQKKQLGALLLRMGKVLEMVEEMAEEMLDRLTRPSAEENPKYGSILGDLIKLIQLFERQYSFLHTIEKQEQELQELPQPDEEVIRSYLNKKWGGSESTTEKES